MNNVFVHILSSRKVWVALAAVAGCLITVFGADPEKWTPLITAIVTLATVVIAAIGAEDASAKFGAGAGATGEGGSVVGSGGSAKQPPTPNPLPTIVLLCCLSLIGCSASPTTRWAIARDTLNTAQNTILDLRQAGKISDRDLVVIDQLTRSAKSALRLAEQELPGGGAGFEWYLRIADEVLTQLSEKKLSAISGQPSAQTPTPKPATPNNQHSTINTQPGGFSGTHGNSRGDPHGTGLGGLGDPAGRRDGRWWSDHRRAA